MLSTPHGLAPSATREAETRIGLSRSPVIRLAAALGYARFPAPQTAVREKFFSYLSTVERVHRSREFDDSTVSVYRGVEAIRSKRNTDA